MGIEHIDRLTDQIVVHYHLRKPYGVPDESGSIEVHYKGIANLPLPPPSPAAITDSCWHEEIDVSVHNTTLTFAFNSYRSGGGPPDEYLSGPYRKLSTPCLIVTLDAIKSDRTLAPGARGDRKIVVSEIYAMKERPATEVIWRPPHDDSEKCPVRVMADTEIAVFTEHAKQTRHYHLKGTEIYEVLEGLMPIGVEGEIHQLRPGDMIVVYPGSVHEVRKDGAQFLARVVSVNCGGASDRYDVSGG